jgi:hypothetical protein
MRCEAIAIANRAARLVYRLTGVMVLVLLTALVIGQTAAAQEVKGSRIEVMVCPQGNESGVSITKPLSDSTVADPVVKVEGTVFSISQINVYVDGQYSTTTAISMGGKTFAIDVSVEPGTHTIKLVASDSCGQQTHEDSVVISYHPQINPGTGSDTATSLSDGGQGASRSEGTTDATGRAATASGDAQTAELAGPNNPLVPDFLEKILRGEAGDGTSTGSATTSTDTAKALSVVAGIFALIWLPVLLEHGFSKRWTGRIEHPLAAVRIAGALLVIIPFVV